MAFQNLVCVKRYLAFKMDTFRRRDTNITQPTILYVFRKKNEMLARLKLATLSEYRK